MPNKNQYSIARSLLPHLPDDIFESWLVPIIKAYSWPFTSITDDTSKTKWKNIFRDPTLAEFAAFRWGKVGFHFNFSAFCFETQVRINSIIDHHRGLNTITANTVRTNERFRAAAEFFSRHGRLPGEDIIVFISKKDGIQILDGHHRIAAAIFVGIPDNFDIEVWTVVTPKIKA